MDLGAIYRDRFGGRTGVVKRDRVWQTLCRSFFNGLIGPDKTILDLACGYGEFINNVTARHKLAVDLNPDARQHLNGDVKFLLVSATNIPIPDGSVDIVFASNFLEHLPDKDTCNQVFEEIKRILVPGGRFIVMGPNIRYAYREYWDWFDHFLPLSDRSLCEGLRQAGFRIIKNIPRFLPVTMEGRAPTADWLIRLYLAIPLVWHVMGKQFLIVAENE
jgi:ubiquinone/menaquinone biosynthesis C-methylase UbiE